jgi:hypothetical protein
MVTGLSIKPIHSNNGAAVATIFESLEMAHPPDSVGSSPEDIGKARMWRYGHRHNFRLIKFVTGAGNCLQRRSHTIRRRAISVMRSLM